MEAEGLSGGNIAIIAASVSAGSAIITAFVTNLFTHWSASSRERRARNSERLANLVVEFLQEFKAFQRTFAEWGILETRLKEIERGVDESDPDTIDGDLPNKLMDVLAEIKPAFKSLEERSSKLDTYQSALEVYAPASVREAYNKVEASVLRAFNLAAGDSVNSPTEITELSQDLEASRRQIAGAIRKELKVKPLRSRISSQSGARNSKPSAPSH